jgi:hypothetical protein
MARNRGADVRETAERLDVFLELLAEARVVMAKMLAPPDVSWKGNGHPAIQIRQWIARYDLLFPRRA